MKIALLQTDIAWNAPTENIARCETLASEAIEAGAELLIFPEMFTCGFSMPDGLTAKESYAQGLSFLSTTAQKHDVATLGSLPETSPTGELFNTAIVCTPDGEAASYRKLHLFSYGDETKKYSPGSKLLTTTVKGVRCSIFICYDLRFPIPFHHVAEHTDLYIVVANWPAPRREHWLTLLRARAIENQAYLAGVNRVGEGGGLSYSGDSVVFGPDGTQLTELTPAQAVITCDIDPGKVAEWRRTFPAVKDRRPSVYSGM